jgi:hypothetical protein
MDLVWPSLVVQNNLAAQIWRYKVVGEAVITTIRGAAIDSSHDRADASARAAHHCCPLRRRRATGLLVELLLPGARTNSIRSVRWSTVTGW